MEGHDPVEQPRSFKFCPLGIQFSSPKELTECKIMDFNLQIPNAEGSEDEIACSGIVAHCEKEPDGSMYKVWVKFLDLPETAQKRIECACSRTEFLCPYCENY